MCKIGRVRLLGAITARLTLAVAIVISFFAVSGQSAFAYTNSWQCTSYTGSVNFKVCIESVNSSITARIAVSSGTYVSGYLQFWEYGTNKDYHNCTSGKFYPGESMTCTYTAPFNRGLWYAVWQSAGGPWYDSPKITVWW
jgi:hypothetical protein